VNSPASTSTAARPQYLNDRSDRITLKMGKKTPNTQVWWEARGWPTRKKSEIQVSTEAERSEH